MTIKLITSVKSFLIVCLFLFSCKEIKNARTEEQNYRVGNITFTVPAENKWLISDSTNNRIAFSLQNAADSMSSVIEVEQLFINEKESKDSIFRHLEDSLINYFLRFKRISPHYNRKEYKGNDCLEYDGIYKDTASAQSSKYFLSYRGLFVQNPADPGKLSYFKLKHSSIQKKIPDDILTSYQKLIESAKFE